MLAPALAVADAAKTFRQDRDGCSRARRRHPRGRAGETLGVVGESGSGKTTLARNPARPDAARPGRDRRARRAPSAASTLVAVRPRTSGRSRSSSRIPMVRSTAASRRGGPSPRGSTKLSGYTARPALGASASSRARARFDGAAAGRRAELGGLKQRVAIARAFAGEPRAVVGDEPTRPRRSVQGRQSSTSCRPPGLAGRLLRLLSRTISVVATWPTGSPCSSAGRRDRRLQPTVFVALHHL